MPEPASIALLGLGLGGMMLRAGARPGWPRWPDRATPIVFGTDGGLPRIPAYRCRQLHIGMACHEWSLFFSACDRAMAEAAPCARAGAHPRLVLATTILASSLAFIDGSVVNVGLPAIGRSLGADGAGLTWIVNGYLLPLSALLLLGGAAGDRFGRRRMLMLGVAIFALASLLCAAAGNVGWLVAGRVLQGCGAALLMPNSLAILGASFEGEARGRAIGTWAAVGAAAGAIGPLVGGQLIDLVGWRSIFLINLPVAALALLLGARALHDAPTGRRAARPGRRCAGQHRAGRPDLGPDGGVRRRRHRRAAGRWRPAPAWRCWRCSCSSNARRARARCCRSHCLPRAVSSA